MVNRFMQPLVAPARLILPHALPAAVMRPARLLCMALVCCCCLLLAACFEARLPDGVVATVNGEPITLRRLQTLLDSRAPSLGAMRTPSLENMRREYGEALGTLIIYALVRQDLQRLQMSVSTAILDAAVAEVKNDYGGGDGLDKYLAEESLDPAEWRALLLDHLSMLAFEKKVLASGIRISLPELRDYYQTHEEDFKMPETLRVCLISAESRKDLDNFCAAFPAAAGETRKKVQLQCLNVRTGDLPQSWQKAAAALKTGQCAPTRQEDGLWRGLALIENHPPAQMNLAEIYPIVEHILREQKMAEAFEDWLEKSLAAATIKVAADIKPDLLAVPTDRVSGQSGGNSAVPAATGGVDEAKAMPATHDEVYEGDIPDGGTGVGTLENQANGSENGAAAKPATDQTRKRDGNSGKKR